MRFAEDLNYITANGHMALRASNRLFERDLRVNRIKQDWHFDR